jgi:hypothetical protein
MSQNDIDMMKDPTGGNNTNVGKGRGGGKGKGGRSDTPGRGKGSGRGRKVSAGSRTRSIRARPPPPANDAATTTTITSLEISKVHDPSTATDNKEASIASINLAVIEIHDVKHVGNGDDHTLAKPPSPVPKVTPAQPYVKRRPSILQGAPPPSFVPSPPRTQTTVSAKTSARSMDYATLKALTSLRALNMNLVVSATENQQICTFLFLILINIQYKNTN